MSTSKYILSLDQGTTSSRAIIFNHQGTIVSMAQREFTQYFPNDGWVEHDPMEIWSSQLTVAEEALKEANLQASDIAAMGITNQRETTLVWDKETGVPVYNAIVWQDRRTDTYCDRLRGRGLENLIRNKTGLLIDPYFSASKIRWILEQDTEIRTKAEQGQLLFGTVDSWLIWKLTGKQQHVTDVTNASRTLLFNIHDLEWDESLLDIFEVPSQMLPKVHSCSEHLGEVNCQSSLDGIPITGVAGDQQAALFGQLCIRKGMVKNTYGTGCFLVMNTGDKPIISNHKLLSTVAWKIGDQVQYALEGSVFMGGAVVQWIRDELDLISDAAEIEALALQVADNGGVYFVPALTGLGAPHWDHYARGIIIGLTRGTNKGHIARAALESICFQSLEVMKAMVADSSIYPKVMRVDGGAVVNNLLMQTQADLLEVPVVRPKILETTALGAAYLAGLAVGFWKDITELEKNAQQERIFRPSMSEEERNKLVQLWTKAVGRCKDWIPASSSTVKS
ncbi:glycerol kinase GlpK [Algivirga pacifica]|uniref:Glycerol kinase n=1 Tax=Algivirga pacifica TaxID=1162670 RepID=A0ABP9DLP2_9BACT